MNYKRIIVCLGSLMILSSGLQTVNAIGPSPAFEKKNNTQEEKEELKQRIIQQVKTQLESGLPQAVQLYEQTALAEALKKDYKELSYPSITEGNDEGITKSGVIDLNSLKKPITEPSRIALAELVRYYQFNFTPSMTFKTLSKNGNGGVSDKDYNSVSEKLNYFDYLKLIQTIKNNKSYTTTERDARLLAVEKDLDTSISLLYGRINGGQAGLTAWGETKTVSIPFNYNKFSYLQLLAAYEKDASVTATLNYYSTVLDTLQAIKSYSVAIRQNKAFSLNVAELKQQLESSYASVNKELVVPMTEVIKRNENDLSRYEAAKQQEKEALTSVGLANSKQSEEAVKKQKAEEKEKER